MRIFLCTVAVTLVLAGRSAEAVSCGNKLSSAETDTLRWLEKYYLYPKDGPNYDWPSSFLPRIVNSHVHALDGTKIPVHRWAYDVVLGPDNGFGPAVPGINVQYSINTASAAEAGQVYEEITQLFNRQYRADLGSGKKKRFDSVFETSLARAQIVLTVTSPGKLSGSTPVFTAGTFRISFRLAQVRHFYFSRHHVMVVNDQLRLSSGTVVPLLPQAKTCEVTIGTVQGATPEVVVGYTYSLTDVAAVDREFVRLREFYAQKFGFHPTEYGIWDTAQDVFVIGHKSEKFEIRLTAPAPASGDGLHTLYEKKPGDTFIHLGVEIHYSGTQQKVPGTDSRLYRAQHSDQAGTEAMAKFEVDPLQQENSRRPAQENSTYGEEPESNGPGLLDGMQ